MIEGLVYIPDFLNKHQQSVLLTEVDEHLWLTDLKRRTQHYGYKYDYKKRSIDESMKVGPFPVMINSLSNLLYEKRVVPLRPDQCIINEYKPGQGIAPHIDCEPCFEDYIVTISLGSVYTMDLSDTKSNQTKKIRLELGSCLVFSGEARYRWRHGIVPRKEDDGIPRERRVSLTFRRVIL